MKTYVKFLVNLFNVSFFKVFIVFFIVILITNILEQIEFFRDLNFNFFYLIFLSFLNSPSIVFQILPFIFLLSTQFFFISLINKKELEIFKYSGLNNLMIIKVISLYTIVASIVIVALFYNGAAILKNSYLIIKNKYTDDNKYLAVITKNGIWIKDEIKNKSSYYVKLANESLGVFKTGSTLYVRSNSSLYAFCNYRNPLLNYDFVSPQIMFNNGGVPEPIKNVIIPKFPEDEYNKDKKFFLNNGFSVLEDNKYGLYLFR